MIVCVCKFVNDRAVRAARDAGARTVEAVGAATGAGTCCGACRPGIAAILAEGRHGDARAEAQPRTSAVPQRAAAGKLDTP